MKHYSWEEIKARASCLEVATTLLGLEVRDGRCAAVWRGGDGFNVALEVGQWFDHGPAEKGGRIGGSVIDLVAVARCGGDVFRAQELLGEHLKLAPRGEVRETRKIVAVYDYRDLAGNVVHQTVRYEPKFFRQRRPDPARVGEWIWSLDDIVTVLYRLPEWHASSWVCLVEGEKDADNVAGLGLPATTVPMGAEKWRPEYGELLRGKNVVIIPDLDAPGRAHAGLVARSLVNVAAAVRIVLLPLDPPGKDVSDWIAAGGTREALLELVKKAPQGVPEWAQGVDAAQAAQLAEAKRANGAPFANYTQVTVAGKGGKERQERLPRPIRELVAEVHQRFLGFPCRVGTQLFDFDRDAKRIRYLDTPAALMAWMAEKSRHPVQWARLEGGVTPAELYESLLANARNYEGISNVPSWPHREDIFYTHEKLPAPNPDRQYFLDFCSFFCPATPEDELLIRAFVASVLYYRPLVARPMWVVDSVTGQESGKSTLVNYVAYLYGGEDPASNSPITVAFRQLQSDTQQDKVFRRLLSRDGRLKRVFLLDNVNSYFECPELAALLTQWTVSGMAPYGRGEENRPNDLTYVLTANSATLDTDLAGRSWFIHLKKAAPDAGWSRRLTEYVRTYRLQIIADIIGVLQEGPQFEFTPATRFERWEHDVLVPVVGSADAYERVWKLNRTRIAASDTEKENAEQARDTIMNGLRELGEVPETARLWLTNEALVAWLTPLIGGKPRTIIHLLKNWAKNGAIPELSTKWESYPHRGENRRRGIGWRTAEVERGTAVPVVAMGKGRDAKPRVELL